MMNFRQLERNGWGLKCPCCGENIRYSLINNQQVPVPFFYAEKGNDVLLRKQDERRVERFYQNQNGAEPSEAALEALWNSILVEAPSAPCGGKFGLWSNVKCPSCGKEMPYNRGVRNVRLRIFEPKIVLIDGAVILGDSGAESWVVKVTSEPAK